MHERQHHGGHRRREQGAIYHLPRHAAHPRPALADDASDASVHVIAALVAYVILVTAIYGVPPAVHDVPSWNDPYLTHGLRAVIWA